MQNGDTKVPPLSVFCFTVWKPKLPSAYMPQPQPQLGATSQHVGAGAQHFLAARRALSLAKQPCFLQHVGAASQQGAGASQHVGAGAQQGAGAGAGSQQATGAGSQQGAGASQQLVSQPQPAARCPKIPALAEETKQRLAATANRATIRFDIRDSPKNLTQV